MTKQAESLPNSPEELLRHCENEVLRLRAKRDGSRQKRAAVLAVSLLVLGLGTLAALMLLFSRLQDLPHPSHEAPPAAAAPIQP